MGPNSTWKLFEKIKIQPTPHPIPLGFPSAPALRLVSCIQPGLVICFTLDSILVSVMGGRREGVSGWETHVNPWLIHVNVWQKPLQYCKVISLQLIKINEKKIQPTKWEKIFLNYMTQIGLLSKIYKLLIKFNA